MASKQVAFRQGIKLQKGKYSSDERAGVNIRIYGMQANACPIESLKGEQTHFLKLDIWCRVYRTLKRINIRC